MRKLVKSRTKLLIYDLGGRQELTHNNLLIFISADKAAVLTGLHIIWVLECSLPVRLSLHLRHLLATIHSHLQLHCTSITTAAYTSLIADTMVLWLDFAYFLWLIFSCFDFYIYCNQRAGVNWHVTHVKITTVK